MTFEFILWIILSGVLVGLTSGIPFGPVGAYCIKKSIENKKHGGYYAGMGASVVDGVYALVASFGISMISGFLISHESAIQTIGGLFLIAVGLREFSTKFSLQGRKSSGKKDFIKGVSVALASPFVIFSFLALYAILGLSRIGGNYLYSFILTVSTFVGSFVSVLFLNWIVIRNKHKVKPATLGRINKAISVIILGTGLYLLIRGVFFS